METIKLSIPNMKSSHCQLTVTNAVKDLGATVKSMAPTQAEIEFGSELTKQAIVQAIEKAGYKVNVKA